MVEPIQLQTAGYYRMRGLLHPALNSQTPDDEILIAPATVVRKTISRYFNMWDIQYTKSSFVIENLSLIELEKLMEIVTITIILLHTDESQATWIKGVKKHLDDKSLEDLILSRNFDCALNYARSVLF